MSHELARVLERPIGRGGGQRDGAGRSVYLTTALTPGMRAVLDREAGERGMSRAALAGAIIEAAMALSEDGLDDLLAGELS